MTTPLAYIAAGYQQVAFVVHDIAAAEKVFCEKLGIERFCRFNHFEVQEAVYRDEPADIDYHLSLAYAGETQIELIQHLAGKSIYKEFLDERGEGVHHLGFILPDHEKVVSDFAANGYAIVQGGKVGETCFAYFDLRDEIGVFIETLVPDDDAKELFASIKRGDF